MNPEPTPTEVPAGAPNPIAGVAADSSNGPRRMWMATFILLAMAALEFVPKMIAENTMVHFLALFLGPLVCTVAFIVWWVVFAKVDGWARRLFPIFLVLPAIPLGMFIFKGYSVQLIVFGMAFMTTMCLLWLHLTLPFPAAVRRNGVFVVLFFGWMIIGLLRVDGQGGNLWPNLRWCWTPSGEELFLAERQSSGRAEKAASSVEVSAPGEGDWPEFRGANRDSRVVGVKIDTDWTAHPPKLLWKHRVGPGWGSFAVVGDRIYTQEQWDKEEAVVCYEAGTGKEIWSKKDEQRWFDAQAGTGPRATPTVVGQRIYTQGAKGLLMCLKAADGTEIWHTNLHDDHKGELPNWGYSSSPLVLGNKVITYLGNPGEQGTAAFDADTGKLVWAKGKATHSYTSAHRARFGGKDLALMTSDYGLEAFDPDSGKVVWEHDFQVKPANRTTQPMLVGDSDVLMTTGAGIKQGMRRLHISGSADKWTVDVKYSVPAPKPYFNDCIIHKGHVYGFDATRLCCHDLESGKSNWKDDGLYKNGQILLLADQDLLLVLGEDGKVALVDAKPEEYNEIASFQAIKGKTWNHPVVAHGKLFVRNADEAACYELKLK